jgi:hypothetical protein
MSLLAQGVILLLHSIWSLSGAKRTSRELRRLYLSLREGSTLVRSSSQTSATLCEMKRGRIPEKELLVSLLVSADSAN